MTEIKIKELKGVGDVELNLDSTKRVFVFLGENGVGKTNLLLSLMYFFLMNTREFSLDVTNNKKNFIMDSLSYNGFKSSINDLINIYSADEYEKDEYYYNTEFLLEIHDEIIEKKLDYDIVVYIPAGLQKISNNIITEIKIGNTDKYSIINLYKHLLTYTFLDGENKVYGVDIRNWFIETAFLSNPYQSKSNIAKKLISAILVSLNTIDSRIDKEFLSLDGSNVFLKIDGQKREISTLSSGFLYIFRLIQRIISSYALLEKDDIFNIKGVVLIDEIESHLHLEWQVKIIPILKNLFPNTTFFITTHSPLVLSQLNEGEAYLLKRDNDGVVRSEIINSPNTRLLENVLQDAFGVNLNQLKRENMENIDQSKAKKKLLDLLNNQASS